MFSTDIIYDVVTFSIGDTKAGTKMGKLQLKGEDDENILNCILWEEALNRIDSKEFRLPQRRRIAFAAGRFGVLEIVGKRLLAASLK